MVDTRSLLTDFAATAAIMARLDLIISMETAAAHLAGAMGKPVWMLIPHASEWRWLAEGTRAPWYPSATLYRQTDPDSWTPVIARMARDLANARPILTTIVEPTEPPSDPGDDEDAHGHVLRG